MSKERNDMVSPSFTPSFASTTETGGRRMEPFKVFTDDEGNHYIFAGTLVVHGRAVSRETTEIPASVWKPGRRFYPVVTRDGTTLKIVYKYQDE